MSAITLGVAATFLGIVIGSVHEWFANPAFQNKVCDVFENTVGFRLRYYRQEASVVGAAVAGFSFAILVFVL